MIRIKINVLREVFYESLYRTILMAVFFLLLSYACTTKSKIPLSRFTELKSEPQFNGMYLNVDGKLGGALDLKDPNDPLSWNGTYNTDLIILSYNGKDSLTIGFWTENGLVQHTYKAKKEENCIEIVPERIRLWIPAVFRDYKFRLRFGSDEANDLQLHVKEDNIAWFFIRVGGYWHDYAVTYNKLSTICQDTSLLIPMQDGGRWGYRNCEGETVIAPTYDFVRLFDEQGIARVKKDGLWGMIDKAGVLIVPCQYSKINTYDERMQGYKIYADEDFGYMRANGDEFIPPLYRRYPTSWRNAGWGNEFPFPVERNGKIGFVDSSGIICPAILDKLLDNSWRELVPGDPSFGKLLKVRYGNRKYYLSFDGYLYPYDHKFFKDETIFLWEQRLKALDIKE